MRFLNCSNGMRRFFQLSAAALLVCGCASSARRLPSPEAERTAPAEGAAVEETMGRAELWARTCSQCHYARGPETFSAEQWDIIMLHMRVRANLTVAEHKMILEFLTSAD